MRRVGHKGADLISPGNTFASFAAALSAGVDAIEFDVIAEHADGSGELLLAHDVEDALGRTPHTLEEGLAHFVASGAPYHGIDFIVDLKAQGYEERVADAIERHGLVRRSLVSTMEEPSLALLRERRPQLRLGWSVPRLQRDPLRNPLVAPSAFVLMHYMRAALPSVAANRIRRGEIDALMAHWRLATPRLARSIRDAGGELYAWTVDDPRRIAGLERMGVTGVISNDPRLFGGAGATS
ncbi:MAG: glycerophosphoryl diester phosphodiesterase [Solirubrobacteraceae bacterium]|nr:glycerophosphoryl diester phosphodiesterase [Solirubrobacteraceae bacterium]